MAKRLSTKNSKRRRDQATVARKGELPRKHKVAVERSKKALFRKALPAT